MYIQLLRSDIAISVQFFSVNCLHSEQWRTGVLLIPFHYEHLRVYQPGWISRIET